MDYRVHVLEVMKNTLTAWTVGFIVYICYLSTLLFLYCAVFNCFILFSCFIKSHAVFAARNSGFIQFHYPQSSSSMKWLGFQWQSVMLLLVVFMNWLLYLFNHYVWMGVKYQENQLKNNWEGFERRERELTFIEKVKEWSNKTKRTNKQTKKFQRVMKINFILSSPEIDIIFRTHGMATKLKGERLQVTFRSLKELYRINYTSCTLSILYWKPNFSGEHTSLKLVKEFELPPHTLSRNLYTTKQFLHAILS